MFVVFEGLDGSGKSTLLDRFKLELSLKKLNFTEAFDPGGTEIGQKIREVLLSNSMKPDKKTELLLYEASRVELVKHIIEPALYQKKWVVSDRYYYSTLAFQGYGRGIDLEIIENLNKFVTNNLVPDVVVWVDTPVEECQKRLGKRKSEGGEMSRLDLEEIEFHQRVYKGYLKTAEYNTDKTKWLILDGMQSKDALYESFKQKFWNLDVVKNEQIN